MEPCCSSPPRLLQRLANGLAIMTFAAAAVVLVWLEWRVWQDGVLPQAALARYVPVDAVVLAHRVEVVGTGHHGWECPRAAVVCRSAPEASGNALSASSRPVPRRQARGRAQGARSRESESFLAHASETYERPVPRYVEQAIRGYLR